MKAILSWVYKFVIFTLIIFAVLEIFEYMVFGGFLYFASNLIGYILPTAILYSVLLGIVFATAQSVMMPGSTHPVRYVSVLPHVSASKSRASAKKKKKAKRRKK